MSQNLSGFIGDIAPDLAESVYIEVSGLGDGGELPLHGHVARERHSKDPNDERELVGQLSRGTVDTVALRRVQLHPIVSEPVDNIAGTAREDT